MRTKKLLDGDRTALCVRLPRRLKQAMKVLATETERPMQELIAEALREALGDTK